MKKRIRSVIVYRILLYDVIASPSCTLKHIVARGSSLADVEQRIPSQYKFFDGF
jgi:hypothetical protein